MIGCAVSNVLLMLHGVAIGAKNYKIFQIIIVSIFINMMHAKNIFAFIEPTKLALANHASSEHIFSDGTKFCFPGFFAFFIYTGLRAIFALYRWGIKKFIMTVMAFMSNLSVISCFLPHHRFNPHGFSLLFGEMPKTLSRAGYCCIGSIWFNIKRIRAVLTNQGYHYASC